MSDRVKMKTFNPCGTPEINRDWVLKHFGIKVRGDEAEVRCPIHGEQHASMRINVVKGVFFCHGCKGRGRLTYLAKTMKVPYAGAKIDGMGLAVLQNKLDQLGRRQRPKATATMDESELRRWAFPTRYWTDERGLNPETVAAFDLGYDPIGGYVTIPIRDEEGVLLGVTRRYLDPNEEQRYRDPKGFEKSHNLFGSWLVAKDDSTQVVLVEGLVDCVKVWQSGHASLAQYGSYISTQQIRLLRQLGVLSVVLFYDNDKAGREAIQFAKGWAKRLVNGKTVWEYTPERDLTRFFIVKLVRYDRSQHGKDPGALPDATIDQMVREASYLDVKLKKALR